MEAEFVRTNLKKQIALCLEELGEGLLSIVVCGASGDLAKKKTFPALFKLHKLGFLPADRINIVGYARSAKTCDEFRSYLRKSLPGDAEAVERFLEKVVYHSTPSYGDESGMSALNEEITKVEEVEGSGNRLFYLAIPPNVFIDVATAIKKCAQSPWEGSWTRLVVEKPFGRDFESAKAQTDLLSALFSEDKLFRIDHYLGKELVQNLLVLRWANGVFEPLWNRQHIDNVRITFKEPFGTEGRGGYFDNFGIIRDVCQNHLTQVLSLLAMEPPVSLDPEDIRDEKVKVLRCIRPLTREDVVVGQYTANGEKPGYTDDPTIPEGRSNTATFAL